MRTYGNNGKNYMDYAVVNGTNCNNILENINKGKSRVYECTQIIFDNYIVEMGFKWVNIKDKIDLNKFRRDTGYKTTKNMMFLVKEYEKNNNGEENINVKLNAEYKEKWNLDHPLGDLFIIIPAIKKSKEKLQEERGVERTNKREEKEKIELVKEYSLNQIKQALRIMEEERGG